MSKDLSRAKQTLLEQWQQGGLRLPPPAAPITSGSPCSRAPASWAQEELMQIELRMPGTARSNISYAGIVDSDIDASAFGAAVHALGQRHETLRTTLLSADDAVWQIIHDEPLGKLESADLSGLAPSLAEQRATARANQLAATPFDLVKGPLTRVALFRLAPACHMVAVVAHHAAADGWSLAIAMQEVSTLYQALIEGRDPELPGLPIQYRDYARWERQWLRTEEAKAHAAYWEKRLRHTVAPRLPRDPEVTASAKAAGMTPVTLSPEITASVRQMASRQDVPVFAVLLAAFGLLLAELTGQSDVSVGTAVANRHHPQTHPLIGLFSNVVPVQFTVSGQYTFSALVQEVRACSAAALSHEAFPLTLYLGTVEPERSLQEEPLYTAVFVLQPPMLPFTLGGKELSPVPLDRGAATSDFALHLWDRGTVIGGTAGYPAAVLSRAAADAMIGRYLDILSQAVASPGRRAGEL